MTQKISFYLIQRLEGRKVVEVLPTPRKFEEAKAYAKTASKLGQRVGITRCEVHLDLVGKLVRKKVVFAA